MSLIIKDSEFIETVKDIEYSTENIIDICGRLNQVVNSIKENAIVDEKIDRKLDDKLNHINKYSAEVSKELASSQKNLNDFLSEIEGIDNLLQ